MPDPTCATCTEPAERQGLCPDCLGALAIELSLCIRCLWDDNARTPACYDLDHNPLCYDHLGPSERDDLATCSGPASLIP